MLYIWLCVERRIDAENFAVLLILVLHFVVCWKSNFFRLGIVFTVKEVGYISRMTVVYDQHHSYVEYIVVALWGCGF